VEFFGGGVNAGADAAEPVEESGQLGDGGVEDANVAASDGGGNGERGGFDAIRKDGVIRRRELFDAMDLNDAGLWKMDASAGGVEESGEFADFGFLCSVADCGGTAGEYCGGKHVAGAGHGGPGRACEIDVGGGELSSAGVDPAVGDLKRGAECSQSAEMQIDGTRADAAAARERDGGSAETCEQRTEETDAGAHAANERWIGGSWGDGWRVNNDTAGNAGWRRSGVVGHGDPCAGRLEQQEHGVDVEQCREVADDSGAADGEGSGEDGKRCIFAATDGDRSRERRPSVNPKILLQKESPTD